MPLPTSLFSRLPAKDGLTAVSNVVKRQTAPIKTQDLYKQALKESVEGSSESNGIRSMRYVLVVQYNNLSNQNSYSYMKRVLLPTLVDQRVVKQIHVKPTLIGNEKVQQLAKLSKSQRQSQSVKVALHGYFGWVPSEPQPIPEPTIPKEPLGAAVGVGEDWSHLNKRRQHSRVKKVQRDVEWVKELDAARQSATKE